MITLKNIKKTYDHFSLEASLHIQPGHITGLIGQNGAGKSTLFKTILQLISIEEGSIEIFGKDIQSLSIEDKANIGIVLSDASFSPYLTIDQIQHILINTYPNFDTSFFYKQIEHFHLPTKKPIKTFSTGMKAKLKVLIALSHQAKLLILDEPTAGLDVIARDEVLNLLREYMMEDETRSIMISSHISSDLESLCDDIYMIDQGKIILHEDTDVLLDTYGILKITEDQLHNIDTSYILKAKKESYGYLCLTTQKQFYLENYPTYTIDKGSIDSIISIMIQGETL